MAGSDDLDAFELVVEDAGSAPVFPLPEHWTAEEHTVGDLAVTVVKPLPGSPADGSTNGIPLVTFHDTGLSASTCFASFFSYAHAGGSCKEVYAASAHYHITAPGCMPDAPVLPASRPFVSLAGLGNMVIDVLDAFRVTRVIGVGAGAGGTVLVEAACARPKLFSGLVLISPLFRASGYAERAWSRMDAAYVGLGLGRRVKDRFLRRWLSEAALDENVDLVSVLDDSLDRLNARNVVRYVQAEAWREDVVSRLKDIKSKVLLITGKDSALREESAECFWMLDPRKTSWVDVMGVGALVHDEEPERVAGALSLFLQGFGVYRENADRLS